MNFNDIGNFSVNIKRFAKKALRGMSGDAQFSIESNLSALMGTLDQIITALEQTASVIATLYSKIVGISKKILVIEGEITEIKAEIVIIDEKIEILDGWVNAALFNRVGGAEQLNAATIIEASGSITGLPKTLYLKRGTWVIDANVDLSAMGSSLYLAPGAELQQVGSFTFKFPLNVTIPDQGFHFSGDVGFIIPKVASKIILDPRWWGALETSDSTDALVALEEATYAQGVDMVLPAGNYGMSGTWEIRQGFSGVGVTITQLDPTVQTNVRSATVYSTLIDNIHITGQITINSIFSRPCLTLISVNGFYVEGVTATNSNDMGYYASLSNGSKYKGCSSLHVRYAVVPSTGSAADGFYHTGCEDMEYEDCYAYDFRRIGFVSEGSALVKSKNTMFIRCIAEYATNEDESTTEYNGGFWAEKTNGATMRDCIAKNIASGIGQNTRRPRGFIIGSSFTENCEFLLDNCRVIENTDVGMIGIEVYGQSGMGDVVITNAFVDRAYQGVVIGGGMKSVSIRDVAFNDFNGNANSAGIIITADFQILSVDGVVETNCTWDANGGTILFFANAPSCDYTLRNAHGSSHAMVNTGGVVKSIRVSDSQISYGCSSRTGFSSRSMMFAHTTFTERVTGAGSLAQYAGTDATNLMSFVNCEIAFVSGGRWQVLGTVTNLQMTGCSTTGGRIRLITTGAYSHLFLGNTFSHGANAAIEYFTGGQTGTCRVEGNYFVGSARPLQQGPLPTNSCPASAIVTGNFYPAAAASITNWSAALSVNNNVAY